MGRGEAEAPRSKASAWRPSEPIAAFLARQGMLLLDGGLASELEARGHDLDDPLWSARLLLEAPGAIAALHADYLRAGADAIISASYQASYEGLARRGLDRAVAAEVMRASVRLARAARDRFWAESDRRAGRLRPLVAASIGPYGAVLADGSEYRGDYGLGPSELMRFHRPRLRLLSESGADLLAIETLPCLAEAEALLTLLDEIPGPPAWIAFSCRDGERLASGEPFAAAVARAAGSPRVLALGVNCTAPRFLPRLLATAAKGCDKPLVAYPNRGERWDDAARCWCQGSAEAAEPEAFAALARGWRTAGARLLGGCCRTGPEDIRAMRRLLLDAPGAGQTRFRAPDA